MIIDEALTLRELKEKIDEAIAAHGDQLPVELISAGRGWANDARANTPNYPVGSVTRFTILS